MKNQHHIPRQLTSPYFSAKGGPIQGKTSRTMRSRSNSPSSSLSLAPKTSSPKGNQDQLNDSRREKLG